MTLEIRPNMRDDDLFQVFGVATDQLWFSTWRGNIEESLLQSLCMVWISYKGSISVGERSTMRSLLSPYEPYLSLIILKRGNFEVNLWVEKWVQKTMTKTREQNEYCYFNKVLTTLLEEWLWNLVNWLKNFTYSLSVFDAATLVLRTLCLKNLLYLTGFGQ